MNSNRYEVLDVIGTGGMATVWRARDLRLGRDVAIKRPNEGIDVAQFEHEARIAARVVHPNVVRVYDVDVDETGPYLVMELVDGPSVAEARPAPEQAVQLGRAVASALAALHSAGIVHGDVKPANVLLADDGAKLTDFGVARRDGDAMSGTVFATPAYAAPEVAAGGFPTAAADVYSLAVVLHEVVTGTSWSSAATTRPLPAGNWAGVLGAALSTDPAIRPDALEFAASLGRLDQMPAAPPTVPLPPSGPPPPIPPRPTGQPAGAPVPPPSDTPRVVPTRGARPGRRRGLLAAAAIVGVVALVAAIAVLATRPGARVASGPTDPTVIPTPAAATTQPTVTTAPPNTTSPTVPGSTTPPSTVPTTVPTTPPSTVESGVATSFDELSQLLESQPPNELKPKDARDLIDRIDRIEQQVGTDPEQTEQELLELAERLARQLDDDPRDTARELMLSLAEQLGVSSDDIEERFEQDDDDEDGDDEDDD